jgi:hypothetical protein
MAGSASNWFKPTAGLLKGQAVYLSGAQRAQVLASVRASVGTLPGNVSAQRRLVERFLSQDPSMTSPAGRLAQQLANSVRPAGVAQTLPAAKPDMETIRQRFHEPTDNAIHGPWKLHFFKWAKQVTPQQRESVDLYQTEIDGYLNMMLRGTGGYRVLDDQGKQVHDDLMALMTPAPANAKFYRGVSGSGSRALLSATPGSSLGTYDQFMSTGLSFGNAKTFAEEDMRTGRPNRDPVVIEVLVPKGTRLVDMTAANPMGRRSDEGEFVLPPDVEVVFHGMTKREGMSVAIVEVRDPRAGQPPTH